MSDRDGIWYRVDSELFNEQDADECAQNWLENQGKDEVDIGQIVTVEAAEFYTPSASYFASNCAESLSESAHDECGESAEGWLEYQPDISSLQEKINKAVDDWATENNEHPTFGVFVKEHPSIEYVVVFGGIQRRDQKAEKG